MDSGDFEQCRLAVKNVLDYVKYSVRSLEETAPVGLCINFLLATMCRCF